MQSPPSAADRHSPSDTGTSWKSGSQLFIIDHQLEVFCCVSSGEVQMSTPHPLSAKIRLGRWLWTTCRLGNILLTHLRDWSRRWLNNFPQELCSQLQDSNNSFSQRCCVCWECLSPAKDTQHHKAPPQGNTCKIWLPVVRCSLGTQASGAVLWRTGNPLQACRSLLPKRAHLLVQQHPWGWRWRSAAVPGRIGPTGRRAARAERRFSRTHTGRWWRADPAAAGQGRCHPGDPPTHPCAARKKIRKGIKTPRRPSP